MYRYRCLYHLEISIRVQAAVGLNAGRMDWFKNGKGYVRLSLVTVHLLTLAEFSSIQLLSRVDSLQPQTTFLKGTCPSPSGTCTQNSCPQLMVPSNYLPSSTHPFLPSIFPHRFFSSLFFLQVAKPWSFNTQ